MGYTPVWFWCRNQNIYYSESYEKRTASTWILFNFNSTWNLGKWTIPDPQNLIGVRAKPYVVKRDKAGPLFRLVHNM